MKKIYKEWFNNGQIKHDYHEEIKPDGEIIDYYKEYFSNGQIKKNRFYDSGFYFKQLYFEDGKIKECKEFGTIDTNIEPPQPSYTSLDDGGWIEETKREEDCFWEETRYYKFTYKELKEWSVDGQLLIEYNKDEHTEWHENGQVKLKKRYDIDYLKTILTIYNSDGWFKRVKNRYQKWHENGQLKEEVNSEDGENDRLLKWHENGQLKEEVYFKHGSVNKTFKWYENGQVKSEQGDKSNDCFNECYHLCYWSELNNYIKKENQLFTTNFGLEKFWYKNGQLKYEINKTEMRKWFEDGKLEFQLKDHSQIYWYNNGQVMIERKNGEHKEWNKNGQLIIHNNNEYREYYENGQIKFISDNEFKEQKKWYINGQIKEIKKHMGESNSHDIKIQKW